MCWRTQLILSSVYNKSCCQMRMTNSNGHSCPPHIAAMESINAAASNNQIGTPQKHKTMKKGTKALTPTSNKKRKNKMATTPTDEKSLEKYSKKAKETLNVIKPGNEEQKERDARQKGRE